MKRRLFTIIALTMLLGGTACSQRNDYSFRTEVLSTEDEGFVYWDKIVVYVTDGQGHTQQLYSQAQPLDTMYWSKSSIGTITEEDWNFDGIPDLQVGLGPTNGSGNFTYDVWLWDNQSHQFVPLECDELIFDPVLDPESKTIVSTWELDNDIEIVRFKWQDGKLVEFEREHMSESELME